jgi:mycothiol synthase
MILFMADLFLAASRGQSPTNLRSVPGGDNANIVGRVILAAENRDSPLGLMVHRPGYDYNHKGPSRGSPQVDQQFSPGLRIVVGSRETAADSLRMVFSQFSSAQAAQYVTSFLAEMLSMPAAFDGLLEARRDGRLVGATFSQVQPGRSAIVWPPRVAAGEPGATAEQLLTAGVDWLSQRDVRVAHALLPSAASADERVLQIAGFRHLADLLYLICRDRDFPETEPQTPLQYEPVDAVSHDRLVNVIAATYQQSLDCPGLGGDRVIDDLLASYRATGAFDPARWFIVRQGGQDVGCLLLTDHPAEENWEMLYMGLVVSARGQGWGREVVRRAQWLARQAGRTGLVLAVDAKNTPARAVYDGVGFRRWDRRTVYIRIF